MIQYSHTGSSIFCELDECRRTSLTGEIPMKGAHVYMFESNQSIYYQDVSSQPSSLNIIIGDRC